MRTKRQLLEEWDRYKPPIQSEKRQKALYTEWKQKLRVDDLVDVLDWDDEWHEAVVIQHTGSTVSVTFPLWDKKWDVVIDLNADENCIFPRNTVVFPWRRAIFDGDFLEVKKGNMWYDAKVMRVRYREHSVDVDLLGSNGTQAMYTIWDSQKRSLLAPHGLHNKKGGDYTSYVRKSVTLNDIVFESPECTILWYWRYKLESIRTSKDLPLADICKSRLPTIQPVSEDTLSEREATIYFLMKTNDDIFKSFISLIDRAHLFTTTSERFSRLL